MGIYKYVDIMSAIRSGKRRVSLTKGTLVTPMAREAADTHGIEITEELMRRPLMAGNWKMNKTGSETVAFIKAFKDKVAGVTDVDIMVAPPYTALNLAGELLKGTNIALGAQNMYPEKNGAYTGEISPPMLRECGCEWVIIGHSERRQYFGCTDGTVNKKLKFAVKEGLKPIVCIGESLQEREKGKTFEVLKKQLSGGLADLSEDEKEALTIAYEPVWAIGTGKTATPAQAEEAHKFIRNTLSEMFTEELAQNIRILYGGSIKPDNISDIMKQENVDGGLVGGASLEAGSFASIVKFRG